MPQLTITSDIISNLKTYKQVTDGINTPNYSNDMRYGNWNVSENNSNYTTMQCGYSMFSLVNYKRHYLYRPILAFDISTLHSEGLSMKSNNGLNPTMKVSIKNITTYVDPLWTDGLFLCLIPSGPEYGTGLQGGLGLNQSAINLSSANGTRYLGSSPGNWLSWNTKDIDPDVNNLAAAQALYSSVTTNIANNSWVEFTLSSGMIRQIMSLGDLDNLRQECYFQLIHASDWYNDFASTNTFQSTTWPTLRVLNRMHSPNATQTADRPLLTIDWTTTAASKIKAEQIAQYTSEGQKASQTWRISGLDVNTQTTTIGGISSLQSSQVYPDKDNPATGVHKMMDTSVQLNRYTDKSRGYQTSHNAYGLGSNTSIPGYAYRDYSAIRGFNKYRTRNDFKYSLDLFYGIDENYVYNDANTKYLFNAFQPHLGKYGTASSLTGPSNGPNSTLNYDGDDYLLAETSSQTNVYGPWADAAHYSAIIDKYTQSNTHGAEWNLVTEFMPIHLFRGKEPKVSIELHAFGDEIHSIYFTYQIKGYSAWQPINSLHIDGQWPTIISNQGILYGPDHPLHVSGAANALDTYWSTQTDPWVTLRLDSDYVNTGSPAAHWTSVMNVDNYRAKTIRFRMTMKTTNTTDHGSGSSSTTFWKADTGVGRWLIEGKLAAERML
tara:strand:- start:3860 stop:5845 length:1986 start_codon:yes stop_codon:yes gene_type:complete